MSQNTQASPRWVKLKHYCTMTGDTPAAVHAKRNKGQWHDGRECKIGPDGNLWINPAAVDAWIEGGQIREEAEALK